MLTLATKKWLIPAAIGFILLLNMHLPAYGFDFETKKPVADSIVIISEDGTCLGGSPILVVSGHNVTWYADSAKTRQLAKGNTYWSAPLYETTTFYLTQTFDGVETAVTPIVVEVLEAFLLSIDKTMAGCGKSDASIIATGKPGTEKHPLLFRLNDGPFQSSGVFNNLAAGTYLLRIQIQDLCWGTIDVVVEELPSPVIADIDSVAPLCGNASGALRIAAYGGRGGLSYSLNGSEFQADNLFENLEGGNYTISVRDDSLCTTSQSASIRNSIPLKLHEIRITPSTCEQSNGRVSVNRAEGNGTITYSLTGRPDQESHEFLHLPAGNYEVSALDEDGCRDSQIIEIPDSTGACGTKLFLPTAFTPNRDGRNDGWAAFFEAPGLQLRTLTIYNRWGSVVFQKEAGTIESGEVLWDGTYKGAVLNGLFTYQMEVEFETGNISKYLGSVLLF